jgi:CRP-like cAMP-binding protein
MPELASIEKVVFLHGVGLFAHCRSEEILRLASIAQERSCLAGEEIYCQDDPAGALYLVVRGRVRVDEGNSEVQSLGPHQPFGALEILSGTRRTAAATAECDSLLLALDAEDFFDLLSNNIEIVKALFRYLTRRLSEEA